MTSASERDPRTYAVIGAAMEVHRVLGNGFLEPVYHHALAIEFAKREIPAQSEVELPVFYKDVLLRPSYRVDFVCFDSLLVEIKALSRLSGSEEAQVLNYLKASRFSTALLLNFGVSSLFFQRFALSESAQSA